MLMTLQQNNLEALSKEPGAQWCTVVINKASWCILSVAMCSGHARVDWILMALEQNNLEAWSKEQGDQ